MTIPSGTVLMDLKDLPDPGGVPVQIGNQSILLVHAAGIVRAYVNRCPHQNRPLCLPSGKTLISEHRFLVCPFHGASFEIESGKGQSGSAEKASLQAVPIKIMNHIIKTN